jgi:predicted TPR repeat methyltransferase
MEDVRFHIAALEQGLAAASGASGGVTPPAPAAAPRSYLESHFDGFASIFDQHLKVKLSYRGPELLLEAVKELGPAAPLDVLDLGCGTGLVGELFKPMARRLVGMDLSAGMLERARARGIYDQLIHDDLASGLHQLAEEGGGSAAFDLALAADVFIYFGDLGTVFSGVGKVLRTGGMLALLTESAETDNAPWSGPDWRLLTTRRYAHSRPHLERLCRENGLEAVLARRVEARQEKDQPVMCWLMVARKA